MYGKAPVSQAIAHWAVRQGNSESC